MTQSHVEDRVNTPETFGHDDWRRSRSDGSWQHGEQADGSHLSPMNANCDDQKAHGGGGVALRGHAVARRRIRLTC